MDTVQEPFDACLDILRRLAPHKTEENLDKLVKLLPEEEGALRNTVDVAAKVLVCPVTSQEFLACDYNRIQGSFYRSPLSDVVVDGEGNGVDDIQPLALSDRLKAIEISANKAFNAYRQVYYEGGISSVYVWPTDNDSFGMAVLIKKGVDGESELVGASWDSTHVIEVEAESAEEYTLCMTSSVILNLEGDFKGIDEFRLGGTMTRQHESNVVIKSDSSLIAAIGKNVEEMESRMRSSLQEIYFGRSHELINGLRPAVIPEGFLRNQADFRAEMQQRCSNR